MRFRIGVTDNSWFEFLADKRPDEVNFWQPGGSSAFKALTPGELFLFKLKSPINQIVGGGFFVKNSIIPISLAWEAFGEKNGASDYATFRGTILKLRNRAGKLEVDPMIGCIILTQPFFFEREAWIRAPEDWHPNIVQGKTYSTNESVGMRIWTEVQSRLSRMNGMRETSRVISEDQARYGSEYMTRARLGKGAFRVLVTDAYKRKCAISGERTLPVLESAHIKPFSETGPNKINNGLLLRADLHKLFDLGYITVTSDFHVEISKRIKEEFENGRDYYALHGHRLISLPDSLTERPSLEYIEWHNGHVYVS